MRHLEPYGYDENNKLSPYKCCDCDVNIHIDNNDEKDNEQDEQIGKKANVSDVQSAFTVVADAINKNASNINELSGKVDSLYADFTSAMTECSSINERQDEQISALSAKTDNFIKNYDIDFVKSGITENLKDEFYTKSETDEKFITSAQCSEMVSGKVDNDVVETMKDNIKNAFTISNAAIATNKDDIEALKLILGVSGDTDVSLIEQIAKNRDAIEFLSGTSIPNLQDLINTKADNESVVNIVNTLNQTIANNTNNLISSIKGNQDAIVDIKHILGTSSSEPSLKTQIDGNHAAIEAIIKTDIPNAVSDLTDKINIKADKSELDKKADKDSVNSISDTVKSFDVYVKQIVNDKADKTAVDDLSDKITNLEEEDKKKADKTDVTSLSVFVTTNSSKIEDLSLNKQDKGNYVSASTLNDYCTKAQVYSKDETDAKIALKQPKGDYVSASTLNNYYTKDQTVLKDNYEEFKSSILSSTSTFANKDLVNSMNSRLGKVESSTSSLLDGLTTIQTELASDYATKYDLADEVESVTSAITENNTLIAKISEIKNLSKYNPETGEFDDSGNGVLDVLHREFHALTSGCSEDSLTGLIKNIDDRLKHIEADFKTLKDFGIVYASGDTIVSGDVDRTLSGRTLTLVQVDGDKIAIPLKDMFKKTDDKIEIVDDDNKLYLKQNGKNLNASELLYMLQNDTY